VEVVGRERIDVPCDYVVDGGGGPHRRHSAAKKKWVPKNSNSKLVFLPYRTKRAPSSLTISAGVPILRSCLSYPEA
jgi:hypothetical protein